MGNTIGKFAPSLIYTELKFENVEDILQNLLQSDEESFALQINFYFDSSRKTYNHEIVEALIQKLIENNNYIFVLYLNQSALHSFFLNQQEDVVTKVLSSLTDEERQERFALLSSLDLLFENIPFDPKFVNNLPLQAKIWHQKDLISEEIQKDLISLYESNLAYATLLSKKLILTDNKEVIIHLLKKLTANQLADLLIDLLDPEDELNFPVIQKFILGLSTEVLLCALSIKPELFSLFYKDNSLNIIALADLYNAYITNAENDKLLVIKDLLKDSFKLYDLILLCCTRSEYNTLDNLGNDNVQTIMQVFEKEEQLVTSNLYKKMVTFLASK